MSESVTIVSTSVLQQSWIRALGGNDDHPRWPFIKVIIKFVSFVGWHGVHVKKCGCPAPLSWGSVVYNNSHKRQTRVLLKIKKNFIINLLLNNWSQTRHKN